MESENLYMRDSYIKEQPATIIKQSDDGVILDKAIFYPQGGGQPADKGYLEYNGKQIPVTAISKIDGMVVHHVAEPIPVGSEVVAKVDWDYRYRLMKHHTSLHVLSAVVYRKYKAKVTGGTIHYDKARLDFDLAEFNKEMAAELVAEVNAELAKGHEVSVEFISRDEIDKHPELIRTKENLIDESITEIRTVKIGDIDLQADGGLHVHNTKEVGTVVLESVKNKGKGRKRISIAATG